MGLIPSAFLDTVVAIGRASPAPQQSYFATGFLFGRRVGPGTEPGMSQFRVFLVTNRHVFDGHNEVVLRFNPPVGAPGRTYQLSLVAPDGTHNWFTHPDAQADVAAMPINTKLLQADGIQYSFFRSSVDVVTRASAVTDEISEGDGVFALGFPLGDAGIDRNYVVVRHGVVARIRDWLAGGARKFLIDSTVFPGNSGGPVILRPEALSLNGTKAHLTAKLLGMVSASVQYQDVAVSQQTNRARIIFEENTGLTVVEPVDTLLETIEPHLPSDTPSAAAPTATDAV